jgi:hypothetical protein
MTRLSISVSKPYYVPGDIVDGTLQLDVSKTIRVRSITVVSEGAEHTHITVSSGKHSHTYRECNPMHQYSVNLSGPAEIPPGTYTYPFRFQLPTSLLPSYRGTNAYISYTVSGNADIPFWFDSAQTLDLLVTIPHQVVRVDARPASFTSGTIQDYSKPAFQVDLKRSMWFAGEVLDGTISLLRNPANKNIRKAEVQLSMLEFAQARGYHRETPCEVARAEIPGDQLACGGPIPFRLQVPRDCYSGYNGVYSRLTWVVRANLDIAWGFDVAGAVEIVVLNAA